MRSEGALADPAATSSRSPSPEAALTPSPRQLQQLWQMCPGLQALSPARLNPFWCAAEPLWRQGGAGDMAALVEALQLWLPDAVSTPPSPRREAVPESPPWFDADAHAIAMAVAEDFIFAHDSDGDPYALTPGASPPSSDASGDADAEDTSTDDAGSELGAAAWELAAPRRRGPAEASETVMSAARHAATHKAADILFAQTPLPAPARAFAPLIYQVLLQQQQATTRQLTGPNLSASARDWAQARADEAAAALLAFARPACPPDEMGPITAASPLPYLAPHAKTTLDLAAHIWWAIHSPAIRHDGKRSTAAGRVSLRAAFVRALADCMETSTTPWGTPQTGRCCPWGYVQRLMQVMSGQMEFNVFVGPTPEELVCAMGQAAFGEPASGATGHAASPAAEPTTAQLDAFYARAMHDAPSVWPDDAYKAGKLDRFKAVVQAYLKSDYGYEPAGLHP